MEIARFAALLDDLDHPDKPTLRKAVDALIEQAARVPELRPLLERRLGAAGHRNYWPVAYVLGHLPKASGAAIRHLLDALDHREPDIRWACALLLNKIAPSEPSLIGLFIELCRIGTANQKRMALYCLRDLTLSDAASLQAMLAALADADATVRVAAVTSLRKRSDGGAMLREELLKCYVDDADIKVRNAAAVTLAQLGAPSESFLQALRCNVAGDDRQAHKAARLALDLLKK